MSHLESLWACYDIVLDDLTRAKWQSKFGREWTYCDLPHHLAYFDHEVIAEGIRRGPATPPDQQMLMRTHRAFNDWNARRLAEGRGQSPEQMMAHMHASRDAIRRAVAPWADADLERQVWISLTGFGGWRTARFALELCRQHTWMHLIQLRLRLHRRAPPIDPAISHGALNSIIRSFAILLNRPRAERIRLTTVLVFSGTGGGIWTVRVADGVCCIAEGGAARADLTLTQSPETLIEVLSAMRHPLTAALTGHIRVQGWRHVPAFLQLFPRPKLDQPLEPIS